MGSSMRSFRLTNGLGVHDLNLQEGPRFKVFAIVQQEIGLVSRTADIDDPRAGPYFRSGGSTRCPREMPRRPGPVPRRHAQ